MKRLVIYVITVMLVSSCSTGVRKGPSPESGPAPLLSFVFDDGNDTDYLVARKVFLKQGAAASFAVVTDWINTKNYLTVSQLLELQNDGFEIMSHTKTHPDLKGLTEEQIASELSASKEALEGWGLRINNLVYPYNKNDAGVRELAGKYYRSARGGRSMLNPAALDRYELKSYPFSHNISKMKKLIESAYAEGKWLIIYLHNIDIRIRASHGNGDFQPGEDLLFSPSGAAGRYTMELFSWLYFVPMSGTPRAGDIITGRTSKAACRLDEIFYNDAEELEGLIKYVHSAHPDMKIVTLDKGLDIYNVK